MREFLTECVAVPTYIICHRIAETGAKAFNKPHRKTKAKSNLGFLGVCIAAIFVIPALCSVIIKPLTDRIYHKNSPEIQPATTYKKMYNQNSTAYLYSLYNKNNSFRTFKNRGMKI